MVNLSELVHSWNGIYIQPLNKHLLVGLWVYYLACLAFRFAAFEHVTSSWLRAGLLAYLTLVTTTAIFDTDFVFADIGNTIIILLTFANIWLTDIRGPVPCEYINIKDKVVLITGANEGIGVETARAIAARGARVVMACRTRRTAEQARESIIKSTGNEKVEIMDIDLSDFSSVRSFVTQLQKSYETIDILINNAGIMLPTRRETKDGLEMTSQVDFLSVYLLTVSLIPQLRRSTIGRIVLVSSTMHKLACWMQGSFDFNDPQCTSYYTMFKAYGQAKLGLELFKYELNRRLRMNGDKITVNSLMPGTIASGITRHLPWILSKCHRILAPLNKTTVSGSYTTVYVATSPQVEATSGKWFEMSCEAPQPSKACEPADAKRIWELCEKITHLKSQVVQI
mmetsp:Transcript_10778/g.17658  ORF Transcript_10778/g.17658 Transcript_10778/m.17658 type:complete len:397 (+) Transcript_10778:76-1266(+)|eukprot:CAMPEP_0203767022 /NCGR_PEP_ID=MMETSP0099_2-20121227/758_1 /ASSEMBLY_ACC=CAM_ASM_000209 /TAXON_ID=96639 /ORGANISM=" , Strain NY0313808BC1" /LENGTH=396 /DNA_ID=CAMNT_0050663469 /DNA_START=9 /DNA_END=1199 /DNA_ORIENTATION=-